MAPFSLENLKFKLVSDLLVILKTLDDSDQQTEPFFLACNIALLLRMTLAKCHLIATVTLKLLNNLAISAVL